jgi:hypothetical protein
MKPDKGATTGALIASVIIYERVRSGEVARLPLNERLLWAMRCARGAECSWALTRADDGLYAAVVGVAISLPTDSPERVSLEEDWELFRKLNAALNARRDGVPVDFAEVFVLIGETERKRIPFMKLWHESAVPA